MCALRLNSAPPPHQKASLSFPSAAAVLVCTRKCVQHGLTRACRPRIARRRVVIRRTIYALAATTTSQAGAPPSLGRLHQAKQRYASIGA